MQKFRNIKNEVHRFLEYNLFKAFHIKIRFKYMNIQLHVKHTFQKFTMTFTFLELAVSL